MSPFGSSVALSPDAFALALSYDKLNSPAGKEAVKTIVTLMTGEMAETAA
jgi:hypothetical protein